MVETTFLPHRFITDAIGRLIGSYAAFAVTYVIDNVSHTPSQFNHIAPLSFAASLILMDYVVTKRFGNRKWFGLISLVVASLLGFVVFFIGAQAYFAISGQIAA